MDVPLLEPSPGSARYQSENWLLDPEYYWEKVGRLSWFELPVLADPVSPLWLDGHSTYHGLNDTISLELADSVGDSLKLIHVDSLQLSVFTERPSETRSGGSRDASGMREPGTACGSPIPNTSGDTLQSWTASILWTSAFSP